VKEIVRRIPTRYLRGFIEGKPGNTCNRIAFHRTMYLIREVPSIRQGCLVFSHEVRCEKKKIVTSEWVRPDNVLLLLVSS
jgi:hypothetical protein